MQKMARTVFITTNPEKGKTLSFSLEQLRAIGLELEGQHRLPNGYKSVLL